MIWPMCHAGRNADGTYSGFVQPGPGAVLVRAEGEFTPARVDPKKFFAAERHDWTEDEKLSAYGTEDYLVISNGRYIQTWYRDQRIIQSYYHAIVLVNPPSDSQPLELTATVIRDKKRQVILLDSDGNGLAGVDVSIYRPLGYDWTFHLRGDKFDMPGLWPDVDQPVTLIHPERGLIASMMARKDSTKPYRVTLEPWGVVTGRLVNSEGKPFTRHQGLVVTNDDPKFGSTYKSTFAEDGTFRIERLSPSQSYSCGKIARGIVVFSSVKVFDYWKLKPGEVHDVGTIVVE